MNKIKEFLQRHGYLIIIGLILVSVSMLFFSVVNYEIREAIYEGSTRISKTDFEYKMNLVSYFTTTYNLNFTMYITLGFFFFSIVFIILGKFVKKQLYAVSALFLVLAICFVALSREFFVAEQNYVMDSAPIVPLALEAGQEQVNSFRGADIGFGAGLSIFFSSVSFLVLLSTNVNKISITTKDMAEDAILIAMAFALNFAKIPVGISGGSINAQMLPLMIIALRRGPIHGFLCGGLIYGLLTCLTDGYGFATFPFDYLIAFGSVGIIGLFRNIILGDNVEKVTLKGELFILLAGFITTLVRYIGSTTSSALVYGLPLFSTSNFLLGSAIGYNIIYIPVSGAIATAILMIIYPALIKINKVFPVKNIQNN